MSEFDGIKRMVGTNASASGPLKLEDLGRMFSAIAAAPAHPCRRGQHLIAAGARPGSTALCADCGTPVRVPLWWTRG